MRLQTILDNMIYRMQLQESLHCELKIWFKQAHDDPFLSTLIQEYRLIQYMYSHSIISDDECLDKFIALYEEFIEWKYEQIIRQMKQTQLQSDYNEVKFFLGLPSTAGAASVAAALRRLIERAKGTEQ